jgi:HK97 family phage prohead protease
MKKDRTIQLPRQTRGAEVNITSFNAADNTIEVCWTTGATVRRRSWLDGLYDEELVVGAENVRLERLNAGAPFLNTHDDYDLESVLGAVVPGSARIENGKGYARVKLSSAEDVADAVTKIKEGTVRNISVGYAIHKVEKTEADDGSVPVWRVVDWEPQEISAVPIPADAGAQVRNAHNLFPCIVTGDDAATTAAPAATTENDTMTIKSNGGAAENSGPTEEQTRAAAEAETQRLNAQTTETATRAATEAAAGAVKADRKRQKDIRELGARLKLDAKFVDEHALGDTSMEEFRKLAIDAVAERAEKAEKEKGTTSVTIEVTRDEQQTEGDAMVEYILARHNAIGSDGRPVPMTERANMFRGSHAVDLAKRTLEWRGQNIRGMTQDEIVARALTPLDAGVHYRSGGLMATSDLPNILAAVANKTLLAAYQAAPQTFRIWTRGIQLPDFKVYNMLRRGETPQLAKVNEHGEFKRGSIKESKETLQLATYGVVVGVTRQVIINDDLGALVSIPSDFAQSSATLESDIVYGILLSNPTLNQDATAVFHANHGNLAAAGSAIDITPLGAGRSKMAKQLGVDGVTTLNLQPEFVLVPPELINRAEQLLLANIQPATNASAIPEGVRRLKPVMEARLSNGVTNAGAGVTAAGSLTAYYLATTQVDTIVYATLQGQSGPYIEQRLGFNVDGVEIKCRHDFGAGAADFRGVYKDPGA